MTGPTINSCYSTTILLIGAQIIVLLVTHAIQYLSSNYYKDFAKNRLGLFIILHGSMVKIFPNIALYRASKTLKLPGPLDGPQT